MEKILLTLDVSKIDKTRINNRKYTNKEGEEVSVSEITLEVVPIKEPQVIKDTDKYTLKKTHFAVHSSTKEERDGGYKSAYVGNGVQFTNKNEYVPNSPKEEGFGPF